MRLTKSATIPHPIHQKCRGAGFAPTFLEAAVFALVPLLTFSELRESDRYPKVNTPLGCDWRILVIDHPLCRKHKS